MVEIKDNYLSDLKLEEVWQEIYQIMPLILENTVTGEALEKKKGYGRLFNNFMAESVLPKTFNITTYKKYNTSLLVNYYQDGGYYDEHIDDCDITEIIMLSKDTNFEGGDLYVEGSKIEHKNNRYVRFRKKPHSVSKIKYTAASQGRFSINYFIKDFSGE